MKYQPAPFKLLVNGQEVDLDIPQDVIISVENLIDNLADQPSLLSFYGQMKADVLHDKVKLEDKLDLFIAVSRHCIREGFAKEVAEEEGKKANGKRLTKDELDDRVSLLDDVIELKAQLRRCEHTYERVNAAYYAIKERGMSLTSIAHAYRAELQINDRLLENKVRSVRNRE